MWEMLKPSFWNMKIKIAFLIIFFSTYCFTQITTSPTPFEVEQSVTITIDENINSTQQFLYDNYTVSLSNEGHIIIIDKNTGNLLSFKSIIGEVDFQSKGIMRDKILYITSKDGRLNAIKIN